MHEITHSFKELCKIGAKRGVDQLDHPLIYCFHPFQEDLFIQWIFIQMGPDLLLVDKVLYYIMLAIIIILRAIKRQSRSRTILIYYFNPGWFSILSNSQCPMYHYSLDPLFAQFLEQLPQVLPFNSPDYAHIITEALYSPFVFYFFIGLEI